MLDAWRRPVGRLFFGLLSVLLFWWGALVAPATAADSGPATTRVSEGLFGSHTGSKKKNRPFRLWRLRFS